MGNKQGSLDPLEKELRSLRQRAALTDLGAFENCPLLLHVLGTPYYEEARELLLETMTKLGQGQNAAALRNAYGLTPDGKVREDDVRTLEYRRDRSPLGGSESLENWENKAISVLVNLLDYTHSKLKSIETLDLRANLIPNGAVTAVAIVDKERDELLFQLDNTETRHVPALMMDIPRTLKLPQRFVIRLYLLQNEGLGSRVYHRFSEDEITAVGFLRNAEPVIQDGNVVTTTFEAPEYGVYYGLTWTPSAAPSQFSFTPSAPAARKPDPALIASLVRPASGPPLIKAPYGLPGLKPTRKDT